MHRKDASVQNWYENCLKLLKRGGFMLKKLREIEEKEGVAQKAEERINGRVGRRMVVGACSPSLARISCQI